VLPFVAAFVGPTVPFEPPLFEAPFVAPLGVPLVVPFVLLFALLAELLSFLPGDREPHAASEVKAARRMSCLMAFSDGFGRRTVPNGRWNFYRRRWAIVGCAPTVRPLRVRFGSRTLNGDMK
jgi:hypothetical protein